MVQRTFDDLGTPLVDVVFVVLDLETTGGSHDRDAITEVGAVKYVGGQRVGTFQTLVDPRTAIPAEIVYLTGITPAMVTGAPSVDAVLPALLEFVGDAVIVGHNVRFDLRFLNANLQRLGYARLRNQVVDTASLARRLVRDEVPNCNLATLARHFRSTTDPCHRALADAQATADVLHALLERVGSMGITGLDDLLSLPSTASHPQVAKLRWVAALPRKPGVYIFRDGAGDAIYVGKAIDLRRRVRSYFAGDDRRKIGPLLREAQALDHVVCPSELEAEVLELRMIHELRPRFNRRDKNPDKSAYLKLSLAEPFPRLSVARARRLGDGCVYLGPLPSAAVVRDAIDAIESVFPLRRCSERPPPVPRQAVCLPAQLGVATCPCAGQVTIDAYRELARTVAVALRSDPSLVMRPLEARMRAHAEAGRFEEAASARNRVNAFVRAVERQRRVDALHASGEVVIEIDGRELSIVRGRLIGGRDCGDQAELPLWDDQPSPVKEIEAEMLAVASWLDRNATRVRLLSCSGEFAWPAQHLPRFEPRRRRVPSRSPIAAA